MSNIQKIKTLESSWIDPAPERELRHPRFLLSVVQFLFSTLGRLFPRQGAVIAYRLFTTPRTRAKHKTSDPILEQARIFEFMYGKRLLKGYEWGPSGGKVILLVHGWESRGTALRSFVPELLEQGYRVVAFDGPAHGNSAGKRTNLPHFAGAIQAVINQIGPIYGILSHSFGGAATVYAMGVLNQQLQANKLVLIAVPSSMVGLLEEASKTLRLPPAVKKRFKQILDGKAGRPIETLSLPGLFPQVQIEDTLIVHDRFDKVVPFRAAENVIEGWDGAHLLATEGYGHFRLVKNPDLIRAVGNFMAYSAS